MSLHRNLQYIKQVYIASHRSLPHAEEYERLAEDALTTCSRWFGPPIDPKKDYSLYCSPEEVSACTYGFGSYMIALCQTEDTQEQRCATIGHEMYHRITMRRDGLRRESWIDEMMAFLAQLWFLRRHGYGEYAQYLASYYAERDSRVEVAAIRAFRRRLPLINLKGLMSLYPESFYPDVSRLAASMNAIVRRRDLVRLPWSRSLEDWLCSLPDGHRAAARCLLECPAGPNEAPDTIPDSVRFAYALRIVGRLDDLGAFSQTARRWSWADTTLEDI